MAQPAEAQSCGKFFDMLEDKGLSYVIAAKMNPVIRSMVGGFKTWLRVDHGIEVAEMMYQAQTWRSSRRIIVIRQKIQNRPEAAGRTLMNVPGYRVQALVTNLTLPPVEIWRSYLGRADAENRIEIRLWNERILFGFFLWNRSSL